MGVGPLHSIDEVTEGNEVMEKRERQDGITTEQAKGRTLRWQPLLPNLWRVNEAARRSGRTRFTALLHHVDVAALDRVSQRDVHEVGGADVTHARQLRRGALALGSSASRSRSAIGTPSCDGAPRRRPRAGGCRPADGENAPGKSRCASRPVVWQRRRDVRTLQLVDDVRVQID